MLPSKLELKRGADFYGCSPEDLEYYMSLGGPDPLEFIPNEPVEDSIIENASERVKKILIVAENAACLEDQPPSASFFDLCRKIMTWQQISGVRS